METTGAGLRFQAVLSRASDVADALREVGDPLEGTVPDVLMVFAAPGMRLDLGALVGGLWDKVKPRHLVGCTAAGVIGPGREVESGPAVSAWGASLPGEIVKSFFIDQDDLEACEDPESFRVRLGVPAEPSPAFVVTADPFSLDVDRFLALMNEAYPGAAVVGGMASAARAPGENGLFLDDQIFTRGLVGWSLAGGAARVRSVVSQGCRPVGRRFVVTRARGNVLEELGGRPAVAALQEVFDAASPQEQALMRRGVHIGRVVEEARESFGVGDFLIRNLVGVVENRGLAVGDVIRPGRTIQFHVRDAGTASDELKSLVAAAAAPTAPAGGLLFSCNGRGERLFGVPNHDVDAVAAAAPCPVAGFFAQGEIGPVGARAFVHGFTASLLLFYAA